MKKTHKKHLWLRRASGFLLAGVVLFWIFGAFVLVSLSSDLPSTEDILAERTRQSTKIYDRTGTVLLYELGGDEKRTVVPFAEIPQSLKNATIAIEDERFYSEPAFDWRGIARAAVRNLSNGRVVQGGSTITQQLAKNMFLSPEQTYTRKLKELIVAFRLSRAYTKDEILELYLNEIPYGSTLYGVESASRAYFGKPVRDLTLAESASLASLPKAPSYYSPWGSHKKDLLSRKDLILKKMKNLGMISDAEFAQAEKTELSFKPQVSVIKAPHFSLMVQEYLAGKYGEDIARNGGLQVITTLDANLQALAEQAVSEGAKRNEKLYAGGNAALVAEDPKTGHILALAGSRDYFDTSHEGNFNVATQGLRQPGSALKPFVYLEAFRKGYTPDTVLFDVPTEFGTDAATCPPIPDYTQNDPACFHPHNFDEKFRGPVSLRQALAQSINIPAVKLLHLVGLQQVLSTLQKFGLKTLVDPSRYGLSLVLGGGEVHLTDLVHAYTVLAGDGVRHEQSFIVSITDADGHTLESPIDTPEEVIAPQYPRLVNKILKDTNLRSGLFQSSLGLTQVPGYEVALKTGTSNDYHDAWAVGYTPSLVAGVWAGNNNNKPMQRHGSSILAAIPIWHDFFAEAIKSYAPETFPDPEEVHVEKPMLNGTYMVDGAVHSILYYADRNDPLGPEPGAASSDPQFPSWESAVTSWARENLGGLLGTPGTSAVNTLRGNSSVAVTIETPRTGDFAGETSIEVNAAILSDAPIWHMSVLTNGVVAHEITGSFGTAYRFSTSLKTDALQAQTLLEVQATNTNGVSAKDGVVIYK